MVFLILVADNSTWDVIVCSKCSATELIHASESLLYLCLQRWRSPASILELFSYSLLNPCSVWDSHIYPRQMLIFRLFFFQVFSWWSSEKHIYCSTELQLCYNVSFIHIYTYIYINSLVLLCLSEDREDLWYSNCTVVQCLLHNAVRAHQSGQSCSQNKSAVLLGPMGHQKL